jgi:MFS transporter, OFA family, oxalate/formate antiporter
MKSAENKWLQIFLLFVVYTSSTISTNCLPFFFPEIAKEFNWSIGKVSEPNSYYFIIIAAFAPLVGFLLSKIQPKTLMLFGVSLAFLSQILLAKMTSFPQFFGIYVALSIAITFSGLLPSMVIITKWFDKQKGIAVGIFLLGSSFGGIIFPQFAKLLMGKYAMNWRDALMGVAILGALVSYLPLIFIKNKPLTNLNQSQINDETQGISLSEAFKTNTFYILLTITAAFWFCGFGVLSHLRLYLNEHNFSLADAANISSIFFVFSIIGKLFFGYISDKYNKENILILATICLILGILFLKIIDQNVNMAYAYAVAYGFGYSGAFAMIQLTVADVYKGKSFSKVLGFVNAFDSLGGFIGVRLLGYLHDQDSNYNSGINALLTVCCVAFTGTILLKMMNLKFKKYENSIK